MELETYSLVGVGLQFHNPRSVRGCIKLGYGGLIRWITLHHGEKSRLGFYENFAVSRDNLSLLLLELSTTSSENSGSILTDVWWRRI